MKKELRVRLTHSNEDDNSLIQKIIYFKSEEDFKKELEDVRIELEKILEEKLMLHNVDNKNFIIVDKSNLTIYHFEIID